MNNKLIFLISRHLLFQFVVGVVALQSAWADTPAASWRGEVEIAPKIWLPLEGEQGRSWFRCEWNGKTVFWPGKLKKGQEGYYDTQIPVILRSWKGRLYLVFKEYDFKLGLTQFIYCKVNEMGTGFEVVEAKAFPRQIATQNIGVNHEGVVYDEKHQEVDRLKIFRELDFANPYFHNSTTGWIWYHLETGRTREEVDPTLAEAVRFYSSYVKKYHPVALPTLMR